MSGSSSSDARREPANVPSLWRPAAAPPFHQGPLSSLLTSPTDLRIHNTTTTRHQHPQTTPRPALTRRPSGLHTPLATILSPHSVRRAKPRRTFLLLQSPHRLRFPPGCALLNSLSVASQSRKPPFILGSCLHTTICATTAGLGLPERNAHKTLSQNTVDQRASTRPRRERHSARRNAGGQRARRAW